jgi:hypothetical protein
MLVERVFGRDGQPWPACRDSIGFLVSMLGLSCGDGECSSVRPGRRRGRASIKTSVFEAFDQIRYNFALILSVFYRNPIRKMLLLRMLTAILEARIFAKLMCNGGWRTSVVLVVLQDLRHEVQSKGQGALSGADNPPY